MKKLTRKLLLSIVAVLFAFATLGTSTFAWFAVNKQVTASSMSVTAADPEAFLKISKTDPASDSGAGLKKNVFLGISATELKLVTPAVIGVQADMVWGEGASDNSNEVDADANIDVLNLTNGSGDHVNIKEVVTGSGQDEKHAHYVLYQELWLKNDSSVDTENLVVDVRATTPDNTKLDNAIRVLVVVESASAHPTDSTTVSGTVAGQSVSEGKVAGKYALFNNAGTVVTTGFQGNAGTDANAGKYMYSAEATSAAADSNKTLMTLLKSNEVVKVTVYVYFDGLDNLAKSVTEVSATPVVLDVAFTINGYTLDWSKLAANAQGEN